MSENVKLQRNPELNALALKLISKHSHLLAGEIIDDLTNTLTTDIDQVEENLSQISDSDIARYKLQADYHMMKSKKVGADAGKLVFHLEAANFYRALQMGFATEQNKKIERWK